MDANPLREKGRGIEEKRRERSIEAEKGNVQTEKGVLRLGSFDVLLSTN